MLMFEHWIVFMAIVIMPISSIYRIRKIKEKPSSSAKIGTYIKSSSLLCIITICILLVNSPRDIFYFQYQLQINLFIIIFLVVCFLFFFITGIMPLLLLKHKEFRSQIVHSFQERQFIFPSTRMEKYFFASLTLVIGFCEEVVFRSFLVHYLYSLPLGLSIIVSFVVAGILFGLVHFIQGSNGMINATLIGFILSFLFVITGSLWVPILVHILHNMKILIIGQVAQSHKGTDVIVREP